MRYTAKGVHGMNNINDNNTIKPNQPVARSYIASDDERPKNPVKSKKNFQKILDNDSSNSLDNELSGVESEEERESFSLFDLAKPKKKPEFKNPLTLMSDTPENVEESLAESINESGSLLKEADLVARKKRFEIPTPPLSANDDDMIAAAEEQSSALSQPQTIKKQPPLSRVPTEKEDGQDGFLENQKIESNKKTNVPTDPKADISYAGLSTQSIAINQADDSSQQDAGSHSFAMRQIIDKLVDSITVVQKEGLTETVVSLRHPPLLEGATLTLTATDEAKNEFNIVFSSLTEAAKAFLDKRLERDSLSTALGQQGFIVNTLITTTQKEITINPGQTPWDHKREKNPENPHGGDPRGQQGKKQEPQG